MKKKLLTLAFGLLLAVGWTSSVFAQDSTYTVAQAKTWTYDWVEGNTTHTGVLYGQALPWSLPECL